MNLKYAELQMVSQGLKCDLTVKSKVIAYGVALAVAQSLALPSSPVDDPQNYFNFQVSMLVNEPLSEVNEGCVFDARLALEKVRMFWLLRYAALHPVNQLTFAETSPYGFIDTIVGAALYVDETSHTFVNENKQDIYRIAFKTMCLMKQPAE